MPYLKNKYKTKQWSQAGFIIWFFVSFKKSKRNKTKQNCRRGREREKLICRIVGDIFPPPSWSSIILSNSLRTIVVFRNKDSSQSYFLYIWSYWLLLSRKSNSNVTKFSLSSHFFFCIFPFSLFSLFQFFSFLFLFFCFFLCLALTEKRLFRHDYTVVLRPKKKKEKHTQDKKL